MSRQKTPRTTQDPADVVALRKGSYVLQSAVASVLRQVRETGIPSASSPATQRRARNRMIADRHAPYGRILIPMSLPCASGEREVAVQSPQPWLRQLAKDSPALAESVRRAHARKPSGPDAPWKLILYFDEVSPQTPSPAVETRKTQNVCWPFAELEQM